MAATPISGIYQIVNLLNGKRYIGSSGDIYGRWKMHVWALTRDRHPNYRLQSSWNKHGAAAFSFAIIELCAKSVLIEREQYYLDTMDAAYNIARLARGGGIPISELVRISVAESNRRRTGWKMSDESRARMSRAKMGNTATKGKPRNPEAVKKTAEAHRGMKRSDKTRAKISAARMGKKCPPRSAEHRAKLSAFQKGKPKSPEHMRALQEGRSRRVYTDEQRAQIGAASRAAWARRRESKIGGYFDLLP